jgi:hypothetical protein
MRFWRDLIRMIRCTKSQLKILKWLAQRPKDLSALMLSTLNRVRATQNGHDI